MDWIIQLSPVIKMRGFGETHNEHNSARFVPSSERTRIHAALVALCLSIACPPGTRHVYDHENRCQSIRAMLGR